jgi:tetratricopeptide (TPR) repeat protein
LSADSAAVEELVEAESALGLGVSVEDKAKKNGTGRSASGIALKPWSPDVPYLKVLREAGPEAYSRYLAIRGEYAASPSFFLDAADFFLDERKDRTLALRVLSNVAELDLGSARLLRILGHRYRQLDELERAAAVFRAVLRLRPEEPQSHRDLGLVLADLGRFEEAIPLLEAVVLGSWDGRFPEIELVTLGELNHVVARCEKETGARHHTLPDSLVRALDTDVRILLTWDADACDMDMWVTEPSGEKAYYSHTRTTIGGHFGRDFTQGYGPEEYLLKKAMPGTYKIQVNYYGNSQQILAGQTTIQVTVIKNYGRDNEERVAVTRRLADKQEVLDIAEITLP